MLTRLTYAYSHPDNAIYKRVLPTKYSAYRRPVSYKRQDVNHAIHYIQITRKRGNCECIATWGHPSVLFRFNYSYDAMPIARSRRTYSLLYYNVSAADTLLYAVTLAYDPVTLTFDL